MPFVKYSAAKLPVYDDDLSAPPAERWRAVCEAEGDNIASLLSDVVHERLENVRCMPVYLEFFVTTVARGMKKTLIPRRVVLALWLTLVSCPTTADEDSATPPPRPRLTVSEDLSRPSSVQGCLSAVCEATNSEDLDAFLACFTTGARRKLRRPAAILFVQHDMSMELVDQKIVDQSGNRAQAAVKYVTTRSGNRYTVCSIVDMQREQGYWKIAKETIQTVDYEPPASCTVSRYSCFGGRCGLAL